MSGPVFITPGPAPIVFPVHPDRESASIFRRTLTRQTIRKLEPKCPFVILSFYGKADSDKDDGRFLLITGQVGGMPMSGTIRQAGLGERHGVRVFFNGVLGVLVAAWLLTSQSTHPAAGLLTNPHQGHWLQKNRQGQSISVKAPGTIYIYSLKPWGGVRIDDVEIPLFAIRDVSVMPSALGDNRPSMTTDLSIVVESEAGMTRGDIHPTVQFLRSRNLNWITTS